MPSKTKQFSRFHIGDLNAQTFFDFDEPVLGAGEIVESTTSPKSLSPLTSEPLVETPVVAGPPPMNSVAVNSSTREATATGSENAANEPNAPACSLVVNTGDTNIATDGDGVVSLSLSACPTPQHDAIHGDVVVETVVTTTVATTPPGVPHSPPAEIALAAVEAVINDVKPEVVEVSKGNKQGILSLGDVEERNFPMERYDRFNALINDTKKKGDRDPLHLASKLMCKYEMTLEELVEQGELGLAKLLSDGLPHGHTGEVRAIKKPAAKARRILICLRRLAEQFPDEGLPVVPIKPKKVKLPRVKLCDEPPVFHDAIIRWGKLSNEERGKEQGEARALTDSTRQSYARHARTFLAAAFALDMMRMTFGIKAMTNREVVEAILRRLEESYTLDSVASMLAAVTRITIDLYGNDPDHQDNIEFLQAETASRFPDLALSAAACQAFDRLLADPLQMKTISDSPREIMDRANESSLKPTARIARAAAAVALQLKFDHVALTPCQAAELDTKVHFRDMESAPKLRLPNQHERGKFRWESLTKQAAVLLAEFELLRNNEGSTLLFPRLSNPCLSQEPRVVMAFIYDEFEVVSKMHMTFDEIKLLKCYKAIKQHPTKLHAIAESAGYKDPRALERAMEVLLTRARKAA